MTPEIWHQVNELFHAALERPVGERTSFLEDLRESDPLIFAEVKSLVDAHEMTNLIDQPVFELAEDLLGTQAESLVGETLAHYEIVSPLGRGGMGEVYLALDSKLDRKIALKLLPARFTRSSDRLSRFVQEAKLASALSHPNIITVHEIGQEDETHYIATEFVDGATLRERLNQGMLRLDETMDITIQVAEALGAAHRAGIIHRDVKPENVMVRHDGYVKVLDFGLATLSEGSPMWSDSTGSRTEWVDSEPGVLMGTVKYMSPEQAGALPIDLRTDIFSLGLVMYEMTAGRHPFEGKTGRDVLTAILTQKPDPISKHNPDIPAGLERVVVKALEKDPALRFQTMDELLDELQHLKAESDFNARLVARGRSAPIRVARFAVVALIVGVAGLAAWLGLRGNSERDNDLVASLRFVPVADWRVAAGDNTIAARFSPDGKSIAFSSNRSGSTKIWIKELTARDPVQVTSGDSIDRTPIWSPDGRQVAFASNRDGQAGIWVTQVSDDNEPTLLMSLPGAGDLPILKRWSSDGERVYYELGFNLFKLSIASGTAEQLTDFKPDNLGSLGITISPDERSVAYAATVDGQSDIWVMALGGNRLRVTNDPAKDSSPEWHPDGNRLVYASLRDGTYQVCVADLTADRTRQVTFRGADCIASDVSPDGTRMLYSSSAEESDIWGVKADGHEEFDVTSDSGAEFWPAVSPDGVTVAYQSTREPGGGSGIFACSIMTVSMSDRLHRKELAANGFSPKWSPDGKMIAFLRSSGGVYSLWTVDAGGAGEKQLTPGGLVFSGFFQVPYTRREHSDFSWSRDGSRIAYCSGKSGRSEVYVISGDGDNEVNISHNEDPTSRLCSPLWSPDGTRIAYVSSWPSRKAGRGSIVWIHDGAKAIQAFSSLDPLRLIGWSSSGDSVYIAKQEGSSYREHAIDLTMFRAAPGSVGERFALLKQARDVHLSADAKMVAFTSRLDGSDNVWLIPSTGGEPRRVTRNTDPRLYVSSLAWSPDGKVIYYGKQWKKSLISMIENFR